MLLRKSVKVLCSEQWCSYLTAPAQYTTRLAAIRRSVEMDERREKNTQHTTMKKLSQLLLCDVIRFYSPNTAHAMENCIGINGNHLNKTNG